MCCWVPCSRRRLHSSKLARGPPPLSGTLVVVGGLYMLMPYLTGSCAPRGLQLEYLRPTVMLGQG